LTKRFTQVRFRNRTTELARFPYVGANLILGSLATVDPATLSGAALDAFRGVETQVVVHTYLGLAIALVLLAAASRWDDQGLFQSPQIRRVAGDQPETFPTVFAETVNRTMTVAAAQASTLPGANSRSSQAPMKRPTMAPPQ
jgi:hypothetical protein